MWGNVCEIVSVPDLRFLLACRSATGAGAKNVEIVRHSHGVTIGVKIRRQMLVVAGVALRAAPLNFGDDVERICRLEAPLVADSLPVRLSSIRTGNIALPRLVVGTRNGEPRRNPVGQGKIDCAFGIDLTVLTYRQAAIAFDPIERRLG